MSGSFEIVGDRFVITNGDRTVATTNGTLLQFLTAEQEFTGSISFPDATKNQLYSWAYFIRRSASPDFESQFRGDVSWFSAVGARPQEWSSTVVLGAAPAGADLFVGRIVLSRTSAPSHTWAGQTISPVMPTGVQIQLGGSMLIELAPGLARALTIDVVPNANPSLPGQLVASLQHSVGPAAGGFGQTGTVPAVAPTTSIPPDNVNSGLENITTSGVAALPVFWRLFAPYYNSGNVEGSGFQGQLAVGTYVNSCRYGGGRAAAYDDPTNYASTYSLTVRGRFGRRS